MGTLLLKRLAIACSISGAVAACESAQSTGHGGNAGSSSSSGGSAVGNASGAAAGAGLGNNAGSNSDPSGAGGAGTSTTEAGAAGLGEPGVGGSSDIACDANGATAEDVSAWIASYKAHHSGNGGKDWDINAKTPEELAADPVAQCFMGLCGADQRPVIPLLAWEYGGSDHAWQNPEASALVYCVYTPVDPSSDHWTYDAQQDHVEADVYVKFPEQNPCKAEAGADQVLACLGDPSNIEILVDTASLDDGSQAGLDLSEATTDLYLLATDTGRTHLYTGL